MKPECLDAFKETTLENASQRVKEPVIARFDLSQQMDGPTRFVLFKVYRSVEATAAPRGRRITPHGATAWRP